ncbi:MAG: hypothetical protein A3I01_00650 [Betaproteobacteria bacterium RIFCSPLOWO2_02_FULL_65_24]|nr:MAG: hypothetical protein A3I01_00650 [Betaproteobacteria bacterium RIFCSPLOWO2_02_FULL_65_24]
MTADRTPRHPDLIGADAALKRAARRALELALQTGTACWVLRDGKIVDIAAEAVLSGMASPQRLIAAEPKPGFSE